MILLSEPVESLFLLLQLPLLTMRYLQYAGRREQLYMLDFCYGVNVLAVACTLLGRSAPQLLTASTFVLANGPALCAIVVWQLWLRINSLESLTSFFLHFAPALIMAKAQWASQEPVEMDAVQIYSGGVLAYVQWQLFNAVALELLTREELHSAVKDLCKPPYAPLPAVILAAARGIGVFRADEDFDPSRWKTKATFMVVQLLYTLLTLSLGLAFFFSTWLNALGLVMIATLSLWKGCSNATSLSYNMGNEKQH